jgi:class 3 adenylate cyclase
LPATTPPSRDLTAPGHPQPELRLVPPEASPFLTTILITDIVGSTIKAAQLGDLRWCALLARHLSDAHADVMCGGGRVVETTGDGILAIFDAPTQAVRAALAIEAAASRGGLAVRAGVHTGECHRLADGVSGIAVHITARVCALAAAGEVLTTSTVRSLVAGSMLGFKARGIRKLRGVPGRWAVYSATDGGA